jgi:DMSO/TMAO reductase YedYZ molybdopterin-dependent catalytic subunit
MTQSELSRRKLLKYSGSAIAGVSVLTVSGPTYAFQTPTGGEVIPWLDQPEPNPVPDVIVRQLTWEELDSWITPPDQHFVIKHFDTPVLTEQDWHLEIGGLVGTPMTLTLADLMARDRQEVTFTIECSGNSAFPFNKGLVGNATWAGAPLAALLEEAGVLEDGIEVVFWGADGGEHVWRDEITINEQFARSMSLADAMAPENILAYEMNGEALPALHGYPLRLIAPGWYGIANVKWLTRIEVMDRRFQGFFMARDYVTIRELEQDGETVWTFTSVGRARLKSAPAKVTVRDNQYSIMGAAWGAPISAVEVRIDDGEWVPATLTEGEGSEYAWVFWTLDWDAPSSGEHEITSRAIDADGNVQPAPDDPLLAGKKTYWESNGHITRHVIIE